MLKMSNILGFRAVSCIIAVSCCFQIVGCVQWDNTFAEKVWVNSSQSVNLVWRYSLNDVKTDGVETVIDCGYLDGANFVELVERVVGKSATKKTVGGSFASRVKVFTSTEDPNQFGITIERVQKTDPKQYRCNANFVRAGTSRADSEISGSRTLEVLDPPDFRNCLVNVQPARYDSTLSITCVVTGNPIPSLQCKLLRQDNSEISDNFIYPRNPSKSNLTDYGFKGDQLKEAKKVVCIADGDKTGIFNKTADVTINHPPFDVREFSQYNPENGDRTTIYLRWKPLLANETGGNLIRYKLEFWVDGTSEQLNKRSRNIEISSLRTDEQSFYTYQFEGANNTVKYQMRLFGENDIVRVVGDFPKAIIVEVMTPPDTDESTGGNTGAIIGGVIGGIVLIVIIIVLCIWCIRRSDKNQRFPTSYVEDAVDYPPNQGPSLYANVDKKPRGVSRTDSTSGYPDVVTSNGHEMRTKSTNSYEPSSKAFV